MVEFDRRPTRRDPLYPQVQGLPGIPWVVLLASAWILFGLFGHDPWKPDEAYTFGVVVDYLKTRDAVVTTLAGEPFVEKPPGIYVAAGAFVELFEGLLPAHDAARLAAGSFVALALLFLALTAREIFGRGFGSAAVLTLLACLGPLTRLHQLIPDVVLLAGVSVGMYGLALARRSLWAAGLALGSGAACAFFGKGLLGPGVLASTALLLPFFPAWRIRRYAATLVVAAIVGAFPAALWMHALFARSPALFHEWLVNNNFGRFLGFSNLGPPANPPGFYAYTLLWYAFPALPLAGYALWTAWRRGDAAERTSLQLPAMLAAVVAVVLGAAHDSRELYLLPLTLPLSLLAAPALGRVPPVAAKALTLLARWSLGSLALLLWLFWLALVTGVPQSLLSQLLERQPGFEPLVQWPQLTVAVVATVSAGRVLLARHLSAGRAIVQWVCGITLCWALTMTLWLPYLDAGMSYRTMLRSLARALPENDCVASLYFGEGQRGLFVYFENVTTVRLERVPDAACKTLLVQRTRATGAPAPSEGWIPVWEGARPGDRKELYRLYRRDVAAGHPIVRFPG